MKLAMIAFTEKGYELGVRLTAKFEGATLSCGGKIFADKIGIPWVSLMQWTKRAFAESDFLLFIGATGIAVRAIAPYLQSKTTDPGVLCMDDGGRYVISLLSGHIGGANTLTVQVADGLGATPIITTATDVHNVFAVDSWATQQGMKIINPHRIKTISGKLLAGETISLQTNIPILGELPKGICLWREDDREADVVICYEQPPQCKSLILLPPKNMTTITMKQ